MRREPHSSSADAAAPNSTGTGSGGASVTAAAAADTYQASNPTLRHAMAVSGDGRLFSGAADAKRLRDLERYMQRHPCILDTSTEWLDAHPEIYPIGILSASTLCIIMCSFMAYDMSYAVTSFLLAYIACAIDIGLYVSLVVGDPGYVTSCKHLHSAAHLEQLPSPTTIIIASSESTPEYCSVCHSCRPERSHHCKRCGRCVNSMDHHCPWIRNCVGARNLKHFMLYTAYTALLALFGLYITASYLFSFQFADADTPLGVAQRTTWDEYWYAYILVLGVTVGGIGVSCYLLFRELYLTARAMTGIELLARTKPKRQSGAPDGVGIGGGSITPAMVSSSLNGTATAISLGEAMMHGTASPVGSAAVNGSGSGTGSGGVIPIFDPVPIENGHSHIHSGGGSRRSSYDRGWWYYNFADALTHPSYSRPVVPTRWSWLLWVVPNWSDAINDIRWWWSNFSFLRLVGL